MLVLRLGSRGKEVIEIQLLLNRLLKPSPKLKPDGYFGKKTEIALMQFQNEKKLTADGIAGKNTWSALGINSKPIKTSSVFTPNAPWYDIACAEHGITETSVAGKHNKRILEYHASTTLKARTDEVPWCSSFVNWVMSQSGIKGTNNALAKSWATWGMEASIPFKGAIAVIKRKNRTSDLRTGSSTGYHVGFYEISTPATITLLGGNQSNKVKSSTFYLRSYEIIAYRRPIQNRLGYPLLQDGLFNNFNFC